MSKVVCAFSTANLHIFFHKHFQQLNCLVIVDPIDACLRHQKFIDSTFFDDFLLSVSVNSRLVVKKDAKTMRIAIF